ncbi:MAG: tyrosine-type recombinase/integrase [Pyrinomonadaceae bacterium]
MSVHQINGHWYYRFSINGVRHRRAIKEARTKKQAEQAEREVRNRIYESVWGESGQRNFGDFVDNVYIPHAKQHKKGFNVERSVLKALISAFGALRMCEITPRLVLEFQQHRLTETTNRGRPRSKATVNRDVAVLSSIFKLAGRLGEVKENPVSKIQYFGNLPKRDRVLSDDEELRLLNGLSDSDLRGKVETYLYTGLRRGELFQLQWRDIDFENGLIRLRPEITKTDKARTVPMLSNVIQILSDMKTKAGKALPEDAVFAGGNSGGAFFSEQLRNACQDIGIEAVTCHTLRHTFSTRANRFGVDPFAQKAALGHSKLSQTADYTHQSNETFRRNWNGFEEHLCQRNDKNGDLQ